MVFFPPPPPPTFLLNPDRPPTVYLCTTGHGLDGWTKETCNDISFQRFEPRTFRIPSTDRDIHLDWCTTRGSSDGACARTLLSP